MTYTITMKGYAHPLRGRAEVVLVSKQSVAHEFDDIMDNDACWNFPAFFWVIKAKIPTFCPLSVAPNSIFKGKIDKNNALL